MLTFKRRLSTSSLFSALTVFASVMIADAHSAPNRSPSLPPSTSESSLYTPIDPDVQRQQAQQRINSGLQQPNNTTQSTLNHLQGRDSSNRGEPAIVGTGTVLQY